MEKINKRFGTSFKPEDQVFVLQQIRAKVVTANPFLKHFAKQNDTVNWDMIYQKAFEKGDD